MLRKGMFNITRRTFAHLSRTPNNAYHKNVLTNYHALTPNYNPVGWTLFIAILGGFSMGLVPWGVKTVMKRDGFFRDASGEEL